MLEHFTESKTPNNTCTTRWQNKNEIVRGADCDHVFMLTNFLEDNMVEQADSLITSFRVIYQQNFFSLIKETNISEVEVDERGNKFFVVHLTAEETEQFDYYYSAYCQIRINLSNEESILSNIGEIEVVNSLESSIKDIDELTQTDEDKE